MARECKYISVTSMGDTVWGHMGEGLLRMTEKFIFFMVVDVEGPVYSGQPRALCFGSWAA